MESRVLPREPDPTDASDDEWAFAAPSPTPMAEDAPQRVHGLGEAFNALRRPVRTGAPWRDLPGDLPPWPAVDQRTRRRREAGCFEAMAHDLGAMLRWGAGRADAPTAAIIDSATRQPTPERGARAGSDGSKRRRGSKLRLAVDTLGHLLALRVTPADAPDRDQVGALAAAVQAATGQTVELAFVARGHAGENPAAAAEEHGIRREVVTLEEAKRGFVLLPRRWVAERPFARASRCRRPAEDDERLPEAVAGLRVLACVTPMRHRLVDVVARSP